MSPAVIPCPKCGGCGEVSDPEGLGALLMQCPKCGGSGSVLPEKLGPPDLSIKAMEDRKVKMHVHVSKGCCQWPPAGVDPRKTPCPCPCHNEDA